MRWFCWGGWRLDDFLSRRSPSLDRFMDRGWILERLVASLGKECIRAGSEGAQGLGRLFDPADVKPEAVIGCLTVRHSMHRFDARIRILDSFEETDEEGNLRVRVGLRVSFARVELNAVVDVSNHWCAFVPHFVARLVAVLDAPGGDV